MKTEQYDNQII